MSFIVRFFLLFILSSTLIKAAPIAAVDENNWLHNRKAMIQTHTGYNQTEIHAVLPRLKTFRLKIQKIENENLIGPEIFIEPAIEATDPQKVLHHKIDIFHIDNLDPNSEYHLELMERSNADELIADRRRFKTWDPKKINPQFTAASCLCDEDRYNATKLPIWTQKRLTNPDFTMLLGDITYVDSFDFVSKPQITILDIYQRYFDSFLDNPGARHYRLTPIISTWDDHDTSNNSNKYSALLKESLTLFNILYGGRTIPGVIENGHDGTYKWLSYGQVDFAVFDARTFREKFDTVENPAQRFGHLGQQQEEWFFTKASQSKNPLVLVKGDMWGSELITETRPDGTIKRITESFYSDHPLNYVEFMKRLQSLPNPYVFISGDIHRAQFIRHGPLQTGPRWNPYVTAEWTTSPLYSFRYNPDDEDKAPWFDKDRYAHKNIFNFGLFKITSDSGEGKTGSEKVVKFEVEIRGDGTKQKDGTKGDWTLPAEPALKDTLILKTKYSNTICARIYNRNY